MLGSFLALALYLAPQELTALTSKVGILFKLHERAQQIQDCIESGITVRYRFTVQMCRETGAWSKECLKEREEARFITYDPITENVELRIDRFADGQPPKLLRVKTIAAALAVATMTDPFSVQFLSHNLSAYLTESSYYIRARAIAFCEGERNFVARVAQALTIGLLGTLSIDTGWDRYNLPVNVLPASSEK